MPEAPRPVGGLRQEDLQVPAIPNSRRDLQKGLAHSLLTDYIVLTYPYIQLPRFPFHLFDQVRSWLLERAKEFMKLDWVPRSMWTISAETLSVTANPILQVTV